MTVVPASTPAEEVLSLGPDGVFLSNGPGDPAARGRGDRRRARAPGPGPRVRHLPGPPDPGPGPGGRAPTSSRSATTAATTPSGASSTGAVEITSQNHNYAVAPGTFEARAEVSHINLNDGVIEGFVCQDVPAFSVQYHPEAGPGPHDARYLFAEFADLMRRCGSPVAEGGGVA